MEQNTTDPSAKNPTTEGAGPVAADSLAAESTRSGGSFGENRDSEPQAVKGSNSTFANEVTSSARTLPAAQNATERGDQSTEKKTLEGTKKSADTKKTETATDNEHQKPSTQTDKTKETSAEKKPSSTSRTSENTDPDTKSYAATAKSASDKPANSNSSDSRGTRDEQPSTTSDQPHSSSSADTAPTYVHSGISKTGGKPHGKNLTEGGFDSDDKNNASFDMDAVGSTNDPGRESLQNLTPAGADDGEKETATEGGVSGNERFGALKEESA